METLRKLVQQKQLINQKINYILKHFQLNVDDVGVVQVPYFEAYAPQELKDEHDKFTSDLGLVDKIIYSTKDLDYPVSEDECCELALFLEFTPQDTAKFINQCASTQEQMNDYLSFHENEMRDYL